MSTTKTVIERANEVGAALRAIHGTSNWSRLQAFIKKETGGKTLSDYLNTSTVTDDAKHKILNDVEDIVKNDKWHLCPEPPAGQADGPAAAVTPSAVAPKQSIAAPAAKSLVSPPAPAPVKPADAPTNPNQPASPFSSDPMAMMAQALAPHLVLLLADKLKVPAPVTVDENMIRKMIREELAVVFEACAKGTRATPVQ